MTLKPFIFALLVLPTCWCKHKSLKWREEKEVVQMPKRPGLVWRSVVCPSPVPGGQADSSQRGAEGAQAARGLSVGFPGRGAGGWASKLAVLSWFESRLGCSRWDIEPKMRAGDWLHVRKPSNVSPSTFGANLWRSLRVCVRQFGLCGLFFFFWQSPAPPLSTFREWSCFFVVVRADFNSKVAEVTASLASPWGEVKGTNRDVRTISLLDECCQNRYSFCAC